MTSQLRRTLGTALAGAVLFVVGFGIGSGDAVSDTQAATGDAIRAAGTLVLLVAAIVASVLLIRGDKARD